VGLRCRRLSPGHLRRSRTPGVRCYAFIIRWLPPSPRTPRRRAATTSLTLNAGLGDLSRHWGLFPSRPRTLAPEDSLPSRRSPGPLGVPSEGVVGEDPLSQGWLYVPRPRGNGVGDGSALHLNAFRREPAKPEFDKPFTPWHGSSESIATPTGSGLRIPRRTLRPGHAKLIPLRVGGGRPRSAGKPDQTRRTFVLAVAGPTPNGSSRPPRHHLRAHYTKGTSSVSKDLRKEVRHPVSTVGTSDGLALSFAVLVHYRSRGPRHPGAGTPLLRPGYTSPGLLWAGHDPSSTGLGTLFRGRGTFDGGVGLGGARPCGPTPMQTGIARRYDRFLD